MTNVRFGIFDHLDRGGRATGELYEHRLGIIGGIERLGFYCYHVAEHHSTPLGMAPSPNLFLSALAQRTKALRFGPLVYLLPLYHPLRLAEEIAMLDQLSGGRLDVGVGRGRSPIEVTLYGGDVAEGRSIFNETLDILRRCFVSDRLAFAGRHFNFPDVPVELRPVQSPHPPLWYGAGAVEGAEDLGRDGFHIVTLAKPDTARAIGEKYHAGVAAAGHRDRMFGLCRFVVVGETDAAAQALAARAYPVWHESFFELFHRFGQKPTQTWSGDFNVMTADGLAIAGSPDTVARVMGEQLRRTGANYLVSQMVFGDMSPGEANRSLELFSTGVMPRIARI